MTPAEAGRVLALLAANWPSLAIGDDTTAVWLAELERIGFDAGQAAAITIIRTEEWFPPLARFLALAAPQPLARRRGEPVTVGERTFLPGTGWISTRSADTTLEPFGAAS